jgi:hypothetical protein
MRRALLGLLIVAGVSVSATEARAQVPFTNVNDPLFTYFGFYLPQQQARSLQSGPEATIQAITANRQQAAATNRNDMFDISSNAFSSAFISDYDFTPGSNGVRRRTLGNSQVSRLGGNLNGLGPQGYYNTVALRSYYPTLRSGRGRNANVSVIKGRGFSGGGGAGVPSIGLPGVR